MSIVCAGRRCAIGFRYSVADCGQHDFPFELDAIFDRKPVEIELANIYCIWAAKCS